MEISAKQLGDLVDHIRTVHFAIVIASCVLVATALSRSNRSLEQAIRDARAIMSLNTPEGHLSVSHAMETQATQTFGVVQKWDWSPTPERPASLDKSRRSRSAPPLPGGSPTDEPGQLVAPNHSASQKPKSISNPIGDIMIPGASEWPGATEYEPWIADDEKAPFRSIFASPYPGWLYLEKRTADGPEEIPSSHEIPTSDAGRVEEKPPEFITLPAWNTLADFQNYWDGLPTLVGIPRIMSEGFKVEKECSDKKTRTFTFGPPQAANESLRYRTRWDEAHQMMALDTRLVYNSGEDLFDCVFTADSAPIADARQALAQELRKANKDPAGDVLYSEVVFVPFSVAFTDLDRQTTNLKHTLLSDVISELTLRLDEAQGTVQLFGVAFPSTVIAYVGTLMILGALLYLLMHLNELAAQLERAPDALPSGYIGLYRQRIARAMTAITLTALPVLGLWLVLAQAHQRIPFVLKLSVAGASAGLGALCVLRLRQISAADERKQRNERGFGIRRNWTRKRQGRRQG